MEDHENEFDELRKNDSETCSLRQFNSVKIPWPMVATRIKPNCKENPSSESQAMMEFTEKVFPNITENINDRDWLNGRSILAATNREVELLNDVISSKLPGSADVFTSADQLENSEDLLRFNSEFLNSLNPNGFPPHALKLKPGTPLLLLRNLNPTQGLCNGTKLIYEQTYHNKVLQCKISGSDRTVLIPRIQFIPQSGEFPFEWRRRQFPVKPAFATTVNKSQGQTLKYVGIWLRTPTFTHGQLYVACSRVGKPEQLKFAIKLDSLGNVPRVNNVVFQEVLLDQ